MKSEQINLLLSSVHIIPILIVIWYKYKNKNGILNSKSDRKSSESSYGLNRNDVLEILFKTRNGIYKETNKVILDCMKKRRKYHSTDKKYIECSKTNKLKKVNLNYEK